MKSRYERGHRLVTQACHVVVEHRIWMMKFLSRQILRLQTERVMKKLKML